MKCPYDFLTQFDAWFNWHKCLYFDKVIPFDPTEQYQLSRFAVGGFCLKGVELTPIVQQIDGGVASEIEYVDPTGIRYGYWAYGHWDPTTRSKVKNTPVSR